MSLTWEVEADTFDGSEYKIKLHIPEVRAELTPREAFEVLSRLDEMRDEISALTAPPNLCTAFRCHMYADPESNSGLCVQHLDIEQGEVA